MKEHIEEWWVLHLWDTTTNKIRISSWSGPHISKDIAIHSAKSLAGYIVAGSDCNDTIEVIYRETQQTVVESIVPPQEYNTGDSNE